MESDIANGDGAIMHGKIMAKQGGDCVEAGIVKGEYVKQLQCRIKRK